MTVFIVLSSSELLHWWPRSDGGWHHPAYLHLHPVQPDLEVQAITIKLPTFSTFDASLLGSDEQKSNSAYER